MVVRIRLARHGIKRRPMFHIVVANARSRRDGKPIEKLGHFSPHPNFQDRTKHIALDFERTRYWLGVGAQPSEMVADLLAKAGLMPPRPYLQNLTPTLTWKAAQRLARKSQASAEKK